MHAATMLGFLGLLLATTLDFGLEIVGLRETGEAVPIWYPVRLLGTVAGMAMMYGVTALMLRRWRKEGRTCGVRSAPTGCSCGCSGSPG